MTDSPDADWIAEALGATSARRGERIQSLWSGYGEIFRVHLTGGEYESAVVKSVRPPRAQKSDRSHARKVRSYDVEMEWYRTFSARCDDACRVPRLLASRSEAGAWTFVLEDLDGAGFSGRHARSTRDVDACLAWLAAFHATFMGEKPERLWKIGTYWHLATRPDELLAIADADLRAAAPSLDAALNGAAFKTFVHGDAKLDNFCFARGRPAVAAVDFQYVGGGCGMKDVAYLLNGARGERERLDDYFRHLRRELETRKPGQNHVDPHAIEREWRSLYPIAVRDFERFLAGWRG